MRALEWRSFPRAAELYTAVSMAIYLILFLGLLMWLSFMGSRVLMSLLALELGASSAAIGMLIALYGLGPLLVGISIDHRGRVPTFLYLALIVVCTWIGWIFCRRLVLRQGRDAKHRAGGGLFNLLAQPRLRKVIVTSALVVAGIDLYTFYMPIYGHAVGLSATMIGIVLGAHAAATFVVRVFLPLLVRRWDEDRVMTASMLLAGATFLMFPFAERVTVLLLLSFVLGLGLGVGQPLSVIMTYNRAPAGRTGEALGLRFSLVNLTHMIIPLAFGTIGSALGLVTVFLANSALMLGGGYAHHRGAKE